MATNNYDNIRIAAQKSIFLGTGTNNSISSDVANNLLIESASGIILNSSGSGINLNSTDYAINFNVSGDTVKSNLNLSTSGTSGGDIVLNSSLATNISSNRTSTWEVNSTNNNENQNLLLTTTSDGSAIGAINLTSGGIFNISGKGNSIINNEGKLSVTASGGNLELGSTGTTSVTSESSVSIGASSAINIGTNNNDININIGNKSSYTPVNINGPLSTSSDVVIAGDLTVNGTQYIVNTTNMDIEDNLIQLNSGSTAANDSGFIMPYVSNGTPVDMTGKTALNGPVTLNQIATDDSTSAYIIGSLISITNGLMSGQSRYILSVGNNVSTMTSNWSPVLLPGTSFIVSTVNTNLTLVKTGGDPFDNTMEGASIRIGNEEYRVSSFVDGNTLLLSENTTEITSTSGYIIEPGLSNYNLYDVTSATMFYSPSNSGFILGYTQDLSNATSITTTSLADLALRNLSASVNTASGSAASFSQSNGSGPLLTFTGSSNSNTVTNGDTLIKTSAGVSITQAGFLKVKVTDTNDTSGMTDKNYYITLNEITVS